MLKRDCVDIIEGLNELLEDSNRDIWRYAKHGMAVLTEGPETNIYRLDYPVESLAVVSDTYHILPLVRNFQYGAHYFLLALSADSFELYLGDFSGIEKLSMPEGIVTRFDELFDDFDNTSSVKAGSYGGTTSANYYGQGDKKDVIEKEMVKLFRYVGQVITDHFTNETAYPVIVASLTQHQTAFREATSIPTLLDQGIEKPFESMSEEEVLESASAIIKNIQEARIVELMERFGVDQAKELASADPATIARALAERKVGVLFVEEGRCIPGSFNIITGELMSSSTDEMQVDGLLDNFAQSAYLQDGEVYVVEPGMMPSSTGVAALFRY